MNDTLQDYLIKRENLINEEKSHRHALSAVGKRASAITEVIRMKEAVSALHCNRFYIASDRALTPENAEAASITITLYHEGRSSASLWDCNYQKNAPVALREASETCPGGPAGFIRFLLTKTTIVEEESLRYHEGIDHIWNRFASMFGTVQHMVFFEPIYRSYVYRMCERLYEDRVFWLEVRYCFVQRLIMPNGNEGSFRDNVLIFQEVVSRFQKEHTDFLGARIIFCTLRSRPSEKIRESMAECIALKKEFPDVICGFDFVGQEDLGRSLKDLLPEILEFQKDCKVQGLEVPLFLHAGETCSDGGEADENVFDALLLGARRIGHGYSLFKHPDLLRLCRERNICIENCPISNEVLRLTASSLSHPLPSVLNHGVAVALCSDDPSILGQESGLSHDFFNVVQAFDSVGLAGLGDMAKNSIEHSAMDERLKQKALLDWHDKWEDFCRWVVNNFQKDIDK